MRTDCHIIAVFAYDFPHRKVQAFLTELYFQRGKGNVVVFAAPRKKLPVEVVSLPVTAEIHHAPLYDISVLCDRFGFEYHCLDHDDTATIAQIVKSRNISMAFIAGARIIKASVIDLFDDGIVNFHPGALPATAGLDSFYYMVCKKAFPGITVHFINEKVDEGALIEFVPLPIMAADTIEIIQENLFILQVKAFSTLLGRLEDMEQSISIHRPQKNQPMTMQEKQEALESFLSWKEWILKQQEMLHVIEQGDMARIKITSMQDIVNEALNYQGWTPLIVAAYAHHKEAILHFLDLGADINHKDIFGRNAADYVDRKKDPDLYAYLQK